MLCAVLAAAKGLEVTLAEQNEKLGKKLFITGKGRCNFTNLCTPEEFLENVLSNPRFLYSSIYALTPSDTVSLFESFGMRTKIERGRRAFPASDLSSDVIDALKRQLKNYGVRVKLHTRITDLIVENGRMTGVILNEKGSVRKLPCDCCVIATGGISYASTGATGDGYRFAEETGHHVTSLSPSLVPVSCREEYIKKMQGLSLRNVELHLQWKHKDIFSEFGELMFTHFGITGPLVLSASAKAGKYIGSPDLASWIDLKPAVTGEMLDARFLKLFSAGRNRSLKNCISEMYPAKMLPVIPEVSGIDPEKRVHDITREERKKLIQSTKQFPLTLTALRGFNEAVVTKGGVSVREINPSTMESRKVKGLYFTGEVLDLDAYTGGYNLQIAWSTAACAANAIAKKKEESDEYSD